MMIWFDFTIGAFSGMIFLCASVAISFKWDEYKYKRENRQKKENIYQQDLYDVIKFWKNNNKDLLGSTLDYVNKKLDTVEHRACLNENSICNIWTKVDRLTSRIDELEKWKDDKA